jgi:uncharacterized protein (DUF488 family)
MLEAYTIGHSNQKLSSFLELIHENNIKILVDVRTSPYSKYASHFNKKPLEISLNEQNIQYVYLGNKIGGKPKDKKFYHEDKLQYHLLEKDVKYKEGLIELLKLSEDNKVVIMCSEEDPYRCHRHHLISQSLIKHNYQVCHIRASGQLEKVESNYQARLF